MSVWKKRKLATGFGEFAAIDSVHLNYDRDGRFLVILFRPAAGYKQDSLFVSGVMDSMRQNAAVLSQNFRDRICIQESVIGIARGDRWELRGSAKSLAKLLTEGRAESHFGDMYGKVNAKALKQVDGIAAILAQKTFPQRTWTQSQNLLRTIRTGLVSRLTCKL